MTILNEKPIKGFAYNFLSRKWEKAKFWYVINGKSEVEAIANFDKGLGLGGACIVEDRDKKVIAEGYLRDISEVTPYKYELQRHRRGL